MSIDVSNLLSLFSSVSGLDGLQLTDTGEAGTAEGFSEALMEQVKLLQEQGTLPKDLEGLSELQDLVGGKGVGKLQELVGAKASGKLQLLDATKETGELHEFAGLLNDYGKSKEPVREAGNKLPLLKELKNNIKIKDINIEETIETLQDVMQHIAAVTDFVEEKAAEVSEVIEQAVAFLQGDSVAEERLDLQEKIAAPLFLTPIEVPGENADKAIQSATDTLVKDVSNNEVLLQSKSAIQDQAIKSNIVAEQNNIPLVFAKEFEKVKPVYPVSSNSVVSATNPDKVVEIVSDLEQEFLDDMLKDQTIFKPGQENQVLDKAKQAEFDLNAFSAINSAEKPAPNLAADISLLNRQMLNTVNEIKTEAPPMTRPFNHPEWQNEFSERIVWMHNKSVQAAELRLNPQHLGPISIRIDVSHDQATIGFAAQHASVREAIEAAIPKLREMLNVQQLNLAEVNVSQQDFSEQRHPQGFFQNGQKQNNQQAANFSMDDDSHNINIENVAELTEEIERGRAVASNGLLNIYA